jgi:Ca2+-binding RTX toxin-like protein
MAILCATAPQFRATVLPSGYAGVADHVFSGGDDTIDGGTGDDVIAGDQLYAFTIAATSEIVGGDDTIDGGGGADVIQGGGIDVMTGGSGDDTFTYLSTADGGDTIVDCDAGHDTIGVSAIDSGDGGAGDFTWGGSIATVNGIWYTEGGSNTTLHFDTRWRHQHRRNDHHAARHRPRTQHDRLRAVD